jgi:hypothetical protein
MAETECPIFIRLITASALKKSDVKIWYDTVKGLAPSGVISSVKVPGPTPGMGLKDAFLISKKLNDKFIYEIPLSRDLVEKEIQPIIFAWTAYFPKGDFDIETSAVKVNEATHRNKSTDAIEIKERDMEDLCHLLAKHNHGRWCADREKNGWKFGLKLNEKEKTHPMIRPWANLPETYKSIDYDLPQVVINLLNDFGYVVVRKTDLSAWLNKK